MSKGLIRRQQHEDFVLELKAWKSGFIQVRLFPSIRGWQTIAAELPQEKAWEFWAWAADDEEEVDFVSAQELLGWFAAKYGARIHGARRT